MGKAKQDGAKKVVVSRRAIVARINRALVEKGQFFVGERGPGDDSRWSIVDRDSSKLTGTFVLLSQAAYHVGVLRNWERVQGEEDVDATTAGPSKSPGSKKPSWWGEGTMPGGIRYAHASKSQVEEAIRHDFTHVLIKSIPEKVPTGWLLVHNPGRPHQNNRGSCFYLVRLDGKPLREHQCDCGWAPGLTHYCWAGRGRAVFGWPGRVVPPARKARVWLGRTLDGRNVYRTPEGRKVYEERASVTLSGRQVTARMNKALKGRARTGRKPKH